MENIRIENTEQPFLVSGFNSSSCSESQTPLRRSSSGTKKQHFIFTTTPVENNNKNFNCNSKKTNNKRHIKESRRQGKYDHVKSKVKEYRIAIRNQTTQRKEESSFEDCLETSSFEDLLKIVELLKQDIEIKDAIIDRKDEEIAELIGKHVEEVALLKLSVDSFRFELTRLKGTIDITRPYKQNNDSTPLKSFGNMLKTPIRSISNAFLRTPLRTFSSTSVTLNKDTKDKSITSDDIQEVEQNSYEDSPIQKPFPKASMKKKSSNGFSESTRYSDPNTAASNDPILKKTTKTKKKNILEQSVSSVFSKVVYYSQKVFSKKTHNLEKTPIAAKSNFQTFVSPKMENTRRRVSFSKTYSESPLPKIIIEDTARGSPKNCIPPPRKPKKLKIHKYFPTKHTKISCHNSRSKSNTEHCCRYNEDREMLITPHIDEIIERSKEIKKIIQKFEQM